MTRALAVVAGRQAGEQASRQSGRQAGGGQAKRHKERGIERKEGHSEVWT